jgi:hypothetical protein
VITSPFVITSSRVIETRARIELTHRHDESLTYSPSTSQPLSGQTAATRARRDLRLQTVMQCALPEQAQATAEQPPEPAKKLQQDNAFGE